MIPAELQERDQWVLWRGEKRDEKITKVPYTPKGKRASSTDPATWVTYEEAESAVPRFDGIGYVFSEDDGLVGLDFDNCRSHGRLNPSVWNTVRYLDSWCEISPSDTGVHVFVKAELNGHANRCSSTAWGGTFEVYDHARYFTVTGKQLAGTPDSIEDRQQQLDDVLTDLFPAPQPVPVLPPPNLGPLDLDDEQLLEKARRARGGDKFTRLFDHGDSSGHGSHSEADLALAGALAFWTGPDPDRIDRLFRRSRLMRDKWARTDYSSRTITAALSDRTAFYKQPASRPVPLAAQSPPRNEHPEETSLVEEIDSPIRERTLISRRSSFTAVELLRSSFPQPRFAVNGILAEGLTFQAGAPQLGKSWMALNMSLAIASGGHALGQIKVERGEVLFLALEDPPRRLKTRLEAVLCGEPAPGGLFFECEWPNLAEGGGDQLDAWLQEHPDCRLVVVDVFARVRPRVSDKSDRYATDYAAAAQLKELADRHRVAIEALHHTRKAAASDFLETVSGTNGLAAAADTVAVVRRARGQADAELHVTGRDIEERAFALRFDPEIGTWTLLGDAEEWQLSATRRQLLTTLRERGPLTPKAAAEHTSLPHETVKKTLQRMAADDQVGAAGGGSYRVPRVPLSPDSEIDGGHAEQGESPDSGAYGGDGGQRDTGDTLLGETEGPSKTTLPISPFSQERQSCAICGAVTFFISMDGSPLCPRHKREAKA